MVEAKVLLVVVVFIFGFSSNTDPRRSHVDGIGVGSGVSIEIERMNSMDECVQVAKAVRTIAIKGKALPNGDNTTSVNVKCVSIQKRGRGITKDVFPESESQ